MTWTDCCTFFVNVDEIYCRFIVSFILGTAFSVFFLFYLYKKETKESYGVVLSKLFKAIFCWLPGQECDGKGKSSFGICCSDYDILYKSVSHKWHVAEMNKRMSHELYEDINDFVEDKNKLTKDSPQSPFLHCKSLAGYTNWSDFDVFSVERSFLKLNFEIICKEFSAVFALLQSGKPYGWRRNNICSGHWCVYPLIEHGMLDERNSLKCPNTVHMLKSLPHFIHSCALANAFYSVVYPDSVIGSHCCSTNLHLRCHLGINGPDGFWMTVGGEKVIVNKKQVVVIDKSYSHSAHFVPKKDMSAAHCMLVFDMWHPGLKETDVEVLTELFQQD